MSRSQVESGEVSRAVGRACWSRHRLQTRALPKPELLAVI